MKTKTFRKTLFTRVFASTIVTIGAAFPSGHAYAELDRDQWTQIGSGVISSGTGADGNPTHNRSGKAIQASWTRDAEQGRKVLWLGTKFGGLWKSVVGADGNIQYWTPLTDNFPGPHGMESFLVNHANSNLILIGPGSADGNIYRTHTQGAQWSAHELPVHDGEKPVQTVYRIRDDSSDPSGMTVIACTNRGIYRSENFGFTWHRKFKSLQGPAVPVFDAVQDVQNPEIWYAAAEVAFVILRSTDGGNSWGSYAPGTFIPGDVARVTLASCDTDQDVLFALVSDQPRHPGDKARFGGLYRSLDRGRNWIRIFDDAEAVDHAQQSQTNNAVACDPVNPNHVIFGCKDQLETFTALFPPDQIIWKGYTPGRPSNLDLGHGDLNYLLFRPGFSSVVICNDGGYYLYHPATGEVDDSGNLLGINALWLTKPQGCLTASRMNPNRFIAGLQDNGVILGDVGTNQLTLIHGSDGGQGSVMPDNDSVLTASATLAQRSVSYESGMAWVNINFDLDTESFPSIQIDPTPGLNNPHIFTHSHDTLELSRVYFRSVFDPVAPWQRASNHPLVGVITHLDHTTDREIHEMLCTRENQRTLFAYTGQRGQLGTLDLVDITPHLSHPTNNKPDAHANADKSGLQPEVLYYTTGASRPSQAFVRPHKGRPWVEVTGNGIPTDASGPDFNKLIANPRNLAQMFLVTSKGVYRTDTAGVLWYPYSEGLRLNEEVQDVVINVHGLDEPTLYIATKGRGFWRRVVH